jgi:crotonobetainyl-CoA:carnitine CoA-transferase CaiB-like acyl-CoA transferase
MSGPLSGISVIDLTAVALGPLATMILADLGADIIKVEPPEGDVTRALAPSRNAGMGAMFLNLNRNKRSIVIDLKKPNAAELLKRLIVRSDVFVHSMRGQTMTRLGFSYDELRVRNPELVYCAAYGFGKDGPYANRPAYDDIIQGACGLAGLEAATGGGMRYVPTILADKVVGLTAAYSIMAALLHRERTGEGQEVEVPMFESMISFVMPEHLSGATFEPALGALGYERLMAPDRRPYATSDGHICVLPYTTKHWRDFFLVAGRPDLANDPRLNDASSRSKHVAELYCLLAAEIAKAPTQEWLRRLDQADIPSGPVNRLSDLLDDPHVVAVDLITRTKHPTEGPLRAVRPPVRFSATPSTIRRPAPRLGEHTIEILREAGLEDAAVTAAIASGAVHQADAG